MAKMQLSDLFERGYVKGKLLSAFVCFPEVIPDSQPITPNSPNTSESNHLNR
jgi:hypothetical protein